MVPSHAEISYDSARRETSRNRNDRRIAKGGRHSFVANALENGQRGWTIIETEIAKNTREKPCVDVRGNPWNTA
jgi:hypothetical protein